MKDPGAFELMVKVHTPAAVVGPHVAGGGVLGVGLTLKLGFTPDTPVHTLLPVCPHRHREGVAVIHAVRVAYGVMLMRKSFHVLTWTAVGQRPVGRHVREGLAGIAHTRRHRTHRRLTRRRRGDDDRALPKRSLIPASHSFHPVVLFAPRLFAMLWLITVFEIGVQFVPSTVPCSVTVKVWLMPTAFVAVPGVICMRTFAYFFNAESVPPGPLFAAVSRGQRLSRRHGVGYTRIRRKVPGAFELMVKVHTPAAVVGPHVAGGGVLGVGLTLKLGFTPDTPVHTLLPCLLHRHREGVAVIHAVRFVWG